MYTLFAKQMIDKKAIYKKWFYKKVKFKIKKNKTKLSVSHGMKKGEKKWNTMQENMM